MNVKVNPLAIFIGAALCSPSLLVAAPADVDVNEIVRDIVITNGKQNVSGIVINTEIFNPGSRQTILDGGFAYSTKIYDGGEQSVSGGGVSNNAYAKGDPGAGAAGYSTLDANGGTVNNASIDDRGWLVVRNGGISNVAVIDGDRALVSVNDGGVINDTIFNNGSISVREGGVANNTIVNINSDNIDAYNFDVIQGVANNTTLLQGGMTVRWNGAIANGTQIHGGTLNVVVSGIANDTVIYNGGTEKINGATANRSTIYVGGIQNVEYNGVSVDSRIEGGEQNIYSGGSAINTTLYKDGGIQRVYENGKATDTTVYKGQSWIHSGALADGTTNIYGSGQLFLENNAHVTDLNLIAGTLNIVDKANEYSPSAQIDKLTMAGGTVAFQRDSEGDFAALNISELNGTGNFLFNSSLADRKSNFVTIEQGSGQFGIAVTDSGKEISDHSDLTVNLIHEQGGDIEFEMVTASGRSTRAIDGGTYMYTLFSQQDKDGLSGGNVWYLGALTEEPGGENPGGENPGGENPGGENPGGENPGGENPGGENPGGENPGGENPGGENPGGGDNGNAGGNGNGGKKPMTTPATDAILAMSNAGLNVVHSELEGLRMYRASLDKTGSESNVWGHYLGSKNNVDTSNGAAYKLNQNGMEIGADTRTDFDRGSLITGAFMSYSDNKVKHDRGGKSKIESYGLGLYATWFDASGFYLDGVMKGNRLNNKLSAVMTNGGKTSGDWNQYAFSTAVEGGYQFDLKDDVSLKPYARLAFVQMTSEDVKLSNGMKGDTGTPRSVTGEAGAKLAGKFSLGSTEFKPYLSAAVVQEFADSNEVTINERNRFDNNVKGTSGKYGLGASVNVGKDVTLYGEANYRQGSNIETPIQGVAGIRVSF